MADCSIELRKTVPIMRVVAAAIMDTHEDIGRVQQSNLHWAARGLKKLDRESLRTGFHRVLLTVNRSTNTATLPPDFSEEYFIGVIVNGVKVPLKLRTDLVDSKNIQEIPCVDKCPKCEQESSICNELTVTEDIKIVVVNDMAVEQTIIKKLYPDGSYYLETKIPVWDIDTEQIIYTTTKEFIAALDLKPCGCIDDTPENIETIKCCCPDVYYSYYAGCDNSCSVDYGGYKIFEDTGLIQFDAIGKFTQVYMEYWGFMPKKNGQYHVPEVAFETLVNWVKFKNVENRRSVPIRERQWTFDQYKRERDNMSKIIGRISLGRIIQSIGLIPKFDLDTDGVYGGCMTSTSYSTVAVAPATQTGSCQPAAESTVVVCPPPATTKNLTPFQLAVISSTAQGVPQPGVNTYQNNALIGAIGLNMIIVNNTNETILAQQFTFDSTTGTITRYQGDGVTPNLWVAGDILVANFSKLI